MLWYYLEIYWDAQMSPSEVYSKEIPTLITLIDKYILS
jgi:hypothetical protein